MTARKKTIIAITGAAGQIGYALLFRLAACGLFEGDIVLRLVELPQAEKALEGIAMELQDGAFPQLAGVEVTSSLEKGFEGANWIVLVGAMPRKPGMERSDLLKNNAPIFEAQGRVINDRAAAGARVLVVGNPCNTNALVAMHHAPDRPKNTFFAMTMLDELRAVALLAQKANVSVTDIDDVIIWGNHSATQYPCIEHARIAGQSAASMMDDSQWYEGFVSTIQQRGAAVLKARGASSAASAANAILETIACVEGKSRSGRSHFSLALPSIGAYGSPKDVVVSYPCYLDASGQIVVEDSWSLSDFSKARLQITYDELLQERTAVGL
jgi:malate dehydrogenase